MNKIKKMMLGLCLMAAFSGSALAQEQEITIHNGETELYAVLNMPELAEGETCTAAILCHGIISSHEEPVIRALADRLAEDGLAVLSFDFDGHGRSGGTFQEMTVSKEISDAEAVLEYVRGLDGVKDIVIAGHSLGGVVSGMVAGRHPDEISALILMAAAGNLGENAQKSFESGEETVSIFGWTLGEDYRDDARTLPIWEVSGQYDGAVCLIYGGADRVVPLSVGEKYHEIYPESELHILEKEGHTFTSGLDEVADIVSDFIWCEVTEKD